MGVRTMAEMGCHRAGHQGRRDQPVAFHRAPPGCASCGQRRHARAEMHSFQPGARALSRGATLQSFGCTVGVEDLRRARRGNPKHADRALAGLALRAGCDDLQRLSRGRERTHARANKRARIVIRTAGVGSAEDANHVGGSSSKV